MHMPHGAVRERADHRGDVPPGGVQVESFGDIKLPGFIPPEVAAEN